MRLVPILLLALLALPGPRQARAGQGEVLSCTYEAEKGAVKLLPGDSIVTRPGGSAAYEVEDAIIRHYLGAPVEATVLRDSAARLELKWEVTISGQTDQQQSAARLKLIYRLVVFRQRGNAARISARPLGYRNYSSANGRCRVSRGGP